MMLSKNSLTRNPEIIDFLGTRSGYSWDIVRRLICISSSLVIRGPNNVVSHRLHCRPVISCKISFCLQKAHWLRLSSEIKKLNPLWIFPRYAAKRNMTGGEKTDGQKWFSIYFEKIPERCAETILPPVTKETKEAIFSGYANPQQSSNSPKLWPENRFQWASCRQRGLFGSVTYQALHFCQTLPV